MSPTQNTLSHIWKPVEGGYVSNVGLMQTEQCKTMIGTPDNFPFNDADKEHDGNGKLVAWHYSHDNGTRYTVENI